MAKGHVGTGRSSIQDQQEKNDHISRGDGRGGHDRDAAQWEKNEGPQAEQAKGHRKSETGSEQHDGDRERDKHNGAGNSNS